METLWKGKSSMKIGITASSSKTQYFVNQAYVQYVADAGFTPILITPEIPDNVVFEMIEGLLLPGGIDLDPIYYGEDNTSSFGVDPEKDAFERKLFHIARERGIPIFGICRGFQLIAREYMRADNKMFEFMYFCEHIGEHNQVDNQQLSRNIHQHFVEYVPQTLYSIKPDKPGPFHTPVNSMHHQCLITDFKQKNVLGARQFKMAAWTQRGLKLAKNKVSTEVVCEAFSISNWGSPILAVQWHPEELRDFSLLQNFFTKGGVYTNNSKTS
jgi:gamma-glutamyl-gamma-aminobutyrate hydrolase PuuD